MANYYEIAGQLVPSASTDQVLYTVPAGNSFLASTLTICNMDKVGDATEYRVAIVPSGDTLAAKHYIEFDELIDLRESKKLTIGITLPAGATVHVRSTSGNVAFGLFGMRIVPDTP